jgi:hypothetical protein
VLMSKQACRLCWDHANVCLGVDCVGLDVTFV